MAKKDFSVLFSKLDVTVAINTRLTRIAFSLLCGLVLSTEVLAQNSNDAAIRLGDSGFTPSLRIEYGQNDNAFRRDQNELDETFIVVRPEVYWSADRGVTEVTASYVGDFKASDQDELNFTDHELRGGISTIFSKRSRGSADIRLALDHLELGQDIFTRFDPTAFDQVEFSRQRARFEHIFGAEQAKGQIITRLLIDNLDYSNNDVATRNSSRLVVQPSVAFSYRVSGDTRTFLAITLSEIDRAANGFDRTDLDVSVGANWKISGRTSGSASIGAGRSALDGASDETDISAQLGLTYTPRSFSRFNLDFERGFFNDGSGTLTDVAIINQLSLDWRYDWSSRLFHRASLDFESVERSCPSVDDQTTNFHLELGLQVRRWLAFGLGGELEQRENGNCPGMVVNQVVDAPDYERQEVFAFVRVNL